MPDNSVDTRQITIYVEASPDAPHIKRFTVDPPNQITLGQCVNVRWNVEGDVNTVTLGVNGSPLWDNAPTKGETQDCPAAAGTVVYGIRGRGAGWYQPGERDHQGRGVEESSRHSRRPRRNSPRRRRSHPRSTRPSSAAFAVSPGGRSRRASRVGIRWSRERWERAIARILRAGGTY